MPLAFCSKFVKVKDLLQLRWNNLYLMLSFFARKTQRRTSWYCAVVHTQYCVKRVMPLFNPFERVMMLETGWGRDLYIQSLKYPLQKENFQNSNRAQKSLAAKKINQNNSMHTDAIFYDHVLNLSCLKWEWIERMQHHKDGKIQRTMKWTIVQLAWPFSPF